MKVALDWDEMYPVYIVKEYKEDQTYARWLDLPADLVTNFIDVQNNQIDKAYMEKYK